MRKYFKELNEACANIRTGLTYLFRKLIKSEHQRRFGRLSEAFGLLSISSGLDENWLHTMGNFENKIRQSLAIMCQRLAQEFYIYPATLGSMSEANNLVVWLDLRQAKAPKAVAQTSLGLRRVRLKQGK